MATIRTSGPLFDGRADKAMNDIVEQITEDVTGVTYNELQTTFGKVLRHPTGYYQSRITTTVSGNEGKIDGDNVIYGHWLEGTGSRNRTTRFKGYFTFRKTAQKMKTRSGDIAQRVVSRNIWRLGG